MAAWTGWLIPIAIALLLGFAATYYLRSIRLPRDERIAGIASLADMRWRAFIKLVMDALDRRGYTRIADAGDTANDGDYLLERDGERWLLSSRHGTSSLLDEHTLAEFANDMRLRGTAGGLLVTPGKFAPEIIQHAKTHRIQLLDGPTLWPELRALLPKEQSAAAVAPARAQVNQHVLLAWAGAAVIGLALGWLLGRGNPARQTAAQPAGHPSAGLLTSRNKTPMSPPVAKKPPPGIDASTAPDDPAELAKRRGEVVSLVSTLPEVDRAVWSTQSTLLVYLVDENANPVSELCPILEHYEELRTSRLQIQPPQGSTKPVRFLQCRTN